MRGSGSDWYFGVRNSGLPGTNWHMLHTTTYNTPSTTAMPTSAIDGIVTMQMPPRLNNA